MCPRITLENLQTSVFENLVCDHPSSFQCEELKYVVSRYKTVQLFLQSGGRGMVCVISPACMGVCDKS